MKNAFFVCILFFCNSGIAQTFPPNFNLVSNGGFEFLKDYNFIEFDSTFTNNNACWIAANKLEVPTYNISWFKPYSYSGSPNGGKNALWFPSSIMWHKDTSVLDTGTIFGTKRYYAETKLIEPLTAGLTYHFAMYIGALKPINKKKWDTTAMQYYPHIIANVGVFFSKNILYQNKHFGSFGVTPQINFTDWDIPYDDSFMYVKVTGSYIATGGEEYITIGNFDHYKDFKLIGNQLASSIDTYNFHPYYPLIDDISLVRDTTQPMISLDKFSLGNDTTLCNGDTMRIGGEPHFFGYKWNTGDTSRFITINKPGTYWCSADFGCNTVTDTIVVSASVAPAAFNIKDTALCEAVLPISISAPYTAAAYLWSNGSKNFSTNFNSIGKQWLRISNACGDQHFTNTFDIKSLNVSLNNINLGKDTNNCLYGFYLDTISLQVPVNAATQIKWSNGSSNSSIKVWEPGTYWVQVSNVCYTVADTINITGCAARDVPKVDIPNAFTPNGDGKNDVFRLKYLPQQVVSFNLKIYNRYGQMISELRNRSDYWDGGNYELGVYYYFFVYKDINGKEYMQKGDISLLR